MARLKLNFASKVTVAGVQRSDTSGAANAERAKLQTEINSAPVNIDRTVFAKDDIERIKLANAKAEWKRQ
jgi:hypothetical protein